MLLKMLLEAPFPFWTPVGLVVPVKLLRVEGSEMLPVELHCNPVQVMRKFVIRVEKFETAVLEPQVEQIVEPVLEELWRVGLGGRTHFSSKKCPRLLSVTSVGILSEGSV